MKKDYKMKKTISIKHFISEFGETFSDHMKKRLLELEVRCVLTRTREESYKLDLKHVEHTRHICDDSHNKEYVYAQFIVNEEALYFSEVCVENDDVVESPIVKEIYNSLNNENIIYDGDNRAKKIDDSNIDYVVDSILSVCPEVSKSYLDIVKGMLSRSER